MVLTMFSTIELVRTSTYFLCLLDAVSGFVQLCYALLYLNNADDESLPKIFLSILFLLINAIFNLSLYLILERELTPPPPVKSRPSYPLNRPSIGIELWISLGNNSLNSSNDLEQPMNNRLTQKAKQPIPPILPDLSGKVGFLFLFPSLITLI